MQNFQIFGMHEENPFPTPEKKNLEILGETEICSTYFASLV